MRNAGMSNLQYLLYALLIFALTGCGASNLSNLAGTSGKDSGKVAAKLTWKDGKSTAKTVAAAPAGVTAIQVTVTGIDNAGKAIPVVRGTIDPVTNQGTIGGIYPGTVTLVVKALSGSVVSFEGFAIGIVVRDGETTTIANPIVMSAPLEKAQDVGCIQCHETTLDSNGQNLVANFKQSGHYSNLAFTLFPAIGITGTGCAGCHGPSHNVPDPAASGRCAECHVPTITDANHLVYTGGNTNTCGSCHVTHNLKLAVAGCVGCHSVGQDANATGTFVNDNNGVRAITTEFDKWSHHVTGVALNDAHCVACHLEGTISAGAVVVDVAVHMSDARTHLRNADTDADFAWDPALPSHTGMDNFCMSCHDANGATSAMSTQIQTLINTSGIAAAGKVASATNPFGDTISNRYDKMQRPAVVDASSQFNTTNNSHHGVKGPRYTGRTRAVGVRRIASPATFAQNSSALLQGVRSTMYDAGVLNQLYEPLEDAAGEVAPRTGASTLGDDSTLHCGDCHTVGQWKQASSVDNLGRPTTAAIGAHGSNNEYLLRNSIGTDQRHTQNAYLVGRVDGSVLNPSTGVPIPANEVLFTNPNGAFLVCYNCHAYAAYGSVFNKTGALGPHAGEYDQAGRCDGVGNTLPFFGYTTGTATDGTQFESRFEGPISKYSKVQTAYPGEQNPDFGDIFGIQCLNCHNSGLGNGYGGIHGSANNTNTTTQLTNPAVLGGAYIDGMGNTTKVERFLPGLGNAMHVPGTLGGFTGGNVVTPAGATYTIVTGGISNDTNWEQKHWQQTAATVINSTTGVVTGTASAGAGCYTLGTGSAASALVGPSVTGEGGAATSGFGTWGGCDDHNAAQGRGDHGAIKRIVRPITY